MSVCADWLVPFFYEFRAQIITLTERGKVKQFPGPLAQSFLTTDVSGIWLNTWVSGN